MAYLLRLARRDAWAHRGRDRRLSLREDHRASYTDPSRRTSGRRIARTWLESCRVFAPYCRPVEPHHGDHSRPARHHGRYGAASCALVWHQSAVLDELAAEL